MKQVNKTVSLMLAILIIFSSFSMSLTAFASEKTYTSGYYTYSVGKVNGDDCATIVDCNTSIRSNVVVPSTIDGYPVYCVDDETFLGCTEITSMAIPSGIRYFNADLTDCEKMTRLTVGNSVNLGASSFPHGICSEITMNEEYAVLEFDRSKKTTVVNVGADLVNFTPFYRYFSVCVTAIEKINLNGNSNFVLVDGVLYTADMKTLCLYPTASTKTSYVMPDTVEWSRDSYLLSDCLYYAKSLESITIGKNYNILFETKEKYDKTYAEYALYYGEEYTIYYLSVLTMALGDGGSHNCLFPYAPNLKKINVSPGHAYLESRDGVLYNKNDKYNVILAYPGSKSGDISLNDNDMAYFFAFMSLQGERTLSISDNYFEKYYKAFEDVARELFDNSEDRAEYAAYLLSDYYGRLLTYTPVSKYYVSPTNPEFSVDEYGVLYDKEYKKIIRFPVYADMELWEAPVGVEMPMEAFISLDPVSFTLIYPKNTRVHVSDLNSGVPVCGVICTDADKNAVVYVDDEGNPVTYEAYINMYNEALANRKAQYAEITREFEEKYNQGKISKSVYDSYANVYYYMTLSFMPEFEFCDGHNDGPVVPDTPDEPVIPDEPVTPDEPKDNCTISINNPSRTEIRNKDGIILHANVGGTVPNGSYVKWESNNGNFDKSADGSKLEIIAKNKGYTTFTAILCDADGNELARSSVEMYSKSGFFDKIGGFFRSLFGTTKIYES